MLIQIFSLLGAVIVLIAYALLRYDVIKAESLIFNALNLIGGIILLTVACIDVRIGFIVLNAVWIMITIFAMIRNWRNNGC